MVQIFTKPHCPQCDATKREFDKHSVSYQSIDLTKDADALDYVKNLGFQQAPVVIALDSSGVKYSWSGFQPAKIREIAGVNVAVA